MEADRITPFRMRLESAAARLEELAKRSSPMVVRTITREVVAVREASVMLEGEHCGMCSGSGRTDVGPCGNCGGTGDL